jgi:molybdopterin-binding protein
MYQAPIDLLLMTEGRGRCFGGTAHPAPERERRQTAQGRVAGHLGGHPAIRPSSASRFWALPGLVAVPVGGFDGAMRFSTRNQLPGTVVSVTLGEAMAVVRIQLDKGGIITSSITRDAVEDLGLAEGSKVTALVKSTEVSLAVE